MTKIQITVEVNSCRECPSCQPHWGIVNQECGLTHFVLYCSASKRYVVIQHTLGGEPEPGLPPVPTWCPRKVIS